MLRLARQPRQSGRATARRAAGRPPRQEVRTIQCRDLLVALVEDGCAHPHNAEMRTRRRWTQAHHLDLDAQRVARTHRPKPAYLHAAAHPAAGDGQRLRHQPARGARRVPAAGDQFTERAVRRGVLADMARMRVELARERDDAVTLHYNLARAAKNLTCYKILEINSASHREIP